MSLTARIPHSQMGDSLCLNMLRLGVSHCAMGAFGKDPHSYVRYK